MIDFFSYFASCIQCHEIKFFFFFLILILIFFMLPFQSDYINKIKEKIRTLFPKAPGNKNESTYAGKKIIKELRTWLYLHINPPRFSLWCWAFHTEKWLFHVSSCIINIHTHTYLLTCLCTCYYSYRYE